MNEQVKGILFDFKDAGWSVQKVEKTLGFSNGSLGKPISEYRFMKLLELHKNEIKKQPAIYSNNGIIQRETVEVTDLTKPTNVVEPQNPLGSEKTNYAINTQNDPKEGSMAFFNKYGVMTYAEIKK